MREIICLREIICFLPCRPAVSTCLVQKLGDDFLTQQWFIIWILMVGNQRGLVHFGKHHTHQYPSYSNHQGYNVLNDKFQSWSVSGRRLVHIKHCLTLFFTVFLFLSSSCMYKHSSRKMTLLATGSWCKLRTTLSLSYNSQVLLI